MNNYAPTTHDALATGGTGTPPAAVRTSAEADTTHVLGGAITIRLRSDDTDGRVGMIDQIVPGGFPGPALHVHPTFDETFYVLDGTLAFRVGEETREGGPGTVAHIPRRVPHTFANPSDQPAHVLVIVTPAGFEAYFEALAARIADRGGFPPVDELVAPASSTAAFPRDSRGPGAILLRHDAANDRRTRSAVVVARNRLS